MEEIPIHLGGACGPAHLQSVRLPARLLGPAHPPCPGLLQVTDMINKFAKKGLTPSQIGVLLRDQHGVAQVKSVTGSKILRILKGQGARPPASPRPTACLALPRPPPCPVLRPSARSAAFLCRPTLRATCPARRPCPGLECAVRRSQQQVLLGRPSAGGWRTLLKPTLANAARSSVAGACCGWRALA